MRPAVAVVIGLSAFAGVAYAATRTARNGPAERFDLSTGYVDPVALLDDFASIGEVVLNQVTEQTANVDNGTAARNVGAFLTVLSVAEGTDRAPDPYRVTMGYRHTIVDLSDHPYFTGEWRGQYFGDPPQLSTAAGKYQILRRTWAGLRDRLGLPDFGPASQDAAAIELIRQRGALEDVKAGRFADAVHKVRKEWASMPGAGYGQGERSLQWLAQHYETNGGTFA